MIMRSEKEGSDTLNLTVIWGPPNPLPSLPFYTDWLTFRRAMVIDPIMTDHL